MTRRKAATSSGLPFQLPPEVEVATVPVPGGMAYVFRHTSLGELGRLRLTSTAGGQTQIMAEVVGDPSDPMTAQRQAIFQPLAMTLIGILEQRMGKGVTAPPVSSPPEPQDPVASQLVQCERCGAGVALLVFADDTGQPGYLEDNARLMYANVARLNVPTWVVGPVKSTGAHRGTFLALKMWPEREAERWLRMAELEPQLDALVAGHCR